MEDKMKCPICGKENRRVYFDESLGRIEEYYSCDNCGYNLEMCYSPIHEWIDLDKWNINKLKELWESQSINAKPVVHGHWIEHYAFGCFHYDCSICDDGFAIKNKQKELPNYCSNCGAKMDEVK